MSRLADGKTIMVLGGAQQHCKLVEAAHNLGARVVVTDYLKNSPAKRISEAFYDIDVNDTESLVELCRIEKVDGVVAGWLDPCQIPYVRLCEALGLPHYGNKMAFEVMTDKELFKKYCLNHDVGTIPFVCIDSKDAISAMDWCDLRFPMFVKPVDSRGSRGQAVCHNWEELSKAVDVAAGESSNGRVIVEQSMAHCDDISVTYFFVNGEPVLERFSDRVLGQEHDGLSNVCIGTISPSKHLQRYMAEAHGNVVKMFESLGIDNGPVFMQGFVDDEGFYFYDPGLRFPGGDYERALNVATGVDFAEELVKLSLGESLSCQYASLAELSGKVEIIHDVSLRPGVIISVAGLDDIEQVEGVVSVNLRYKSGETVGAERNVGRRFAEINYLANDYEEALEKSVRIQSLLSVEDCDGDMKVSPFNDGFAEWYESFKLDGR